MSPPPPPPSKLRLRNKTGGARSFLGGGAQYNNTICPLCPVAEYASYEREREREQERERERRKKYGSYGKF